MPMSPTSTRSRCLRRARATEPRHRHVGHGFRQDGILHAADPRPARAGSGVVAAPLRPLDDQWLEKGREFQHHRRNEHPDRPQAVRALILYPLNALSSKTRWFACARRLIPTKLRMSWRATSMATASSSADTRASPPSPGFLRHPRKAKDEAWKKRNARDAGS